MPRVTISEPGKTPQPYRFKLGRKVIHIGRGSDNDIVVECGSASTKHCTMERVDGGYILRDRGSTNGIKQDDTLMEVIDLFDGMEVYIGDVPFKFQLSDEEIEHLADEEFTTHQKKKLPPPKQEEEEHHPSTSSPRASHVNRSQPTVQESGGALKTLVVFLLVLVAIFAGMTIRHSMRTGDFLPTKLMGGTKSDASDKTPSTKETPDPPADEPGTPAE
ncbi:MAG: FHA domain-containing protein, partial [Verrucomicrobiae bacterium]|nr:FHA domain-containing protein [Verrucomicrobiae bacterium]NNJ86119.1 FHA domain-containing protein [Akkermansiaceae bacterium]